MKNLTLLEFCQESYDNTRGVQDWKFESVEAFISEVGELEGNDVIKEYKSTK